MKKLTFKELLRLMDEKNVTLHLESDFSGEVLFYPNEKKLFEFANEEELHEGLIKLKSVSK